MYLEDELSLLVSCTLCPRECRVNRLNGELGFCKSDAGFNISSICVHKGEEPVISGKKGICNIFFPHCNLQCIYCQNHDISRNTGNCYSETLSFEEVIERICTTLEQTENIVGFVSPSHYIPQTMAIIRGLHEVGKKPVIVYNTNGYDKVESLQMLEGLVDIYLPDFKYIDSALALEYSQALDYPEVAKSALKEMYRQKGSTLIVNENGIAESGIIIRHLLLPCASAQSIDILRYIAEEISPKIHISLMSQYFPTSMVVKHPVLKRNITFDEYNKIVEAFHELGFYRGWVQELESHASYHPDFSNEKPFEL
jgi:putative pyruvate formate lyase activating enzyme